MSATSTPNIAFAYTTNNNGTSLAYIDPTTNSLTDLGDFYDENDLTNPLGGVHNGVNTGVYGLAYGQDGNLYVTQQEAGDNGTTQIWKVTLPPTNDNKVKLKKIGSGTGLLNVNGTVDTTAVTVHAMDIGPDGQMYLLDYEGRLSTVDLTTGKATFVTEATGDTITQAPMDITFDNEGILYVVDHSNFYTYNITTGSRKLIKGSIGKSLMGLWSDGEGNLYATGFKNPGTYFSINKTSGELIELSSNAGIEPHGGDLYIAYTGWPGGETVEDGETVDTGKTVEINYLSGSDKTTNISMVTTADVINSEARAALGDSGITLQTDSLNFEAEIDESIPRTTFNLELSNLNFENGAITTSEGERDTSQKLLYYSVDDEGEVSALSFDPLVNAGARFYDLDGDGLADYLSLTLVDGGFGDKDGEKNGVIVDPSTAATVALDPVIKPKDGPFNLLTIADPDNDAPVALNLNATITGRGETVNQIGYIVLDADEVAEETAKTILGDLDQLKQRATILFNSLEVKDVTLAKAFQFSRDLLIRNGQSVRFFSLEDTTLDKLSSLDDPNFSFLKASETSDGSFCFSSGTGLSFDLALNANDQGLAALVAQAQDLAPVLNTAPFMNGETLNGTLVLAREATLDAVTGLYKVVDPTGVVMAADGSLIAPGAAGYTEAALRADNLYGGDDFKFSLANGKTQDSALAMENLGAYLAPYAKVQTNTFFAFAKANSDGISHFRSLGNNIWGLEDQLGGGDLDFDDQILGFNFTSITAATTNTETPA